MTNNAFGITPEQLAASYAATLTVGSFSPPQPMSEVGWLLQSEAHYKADRAQYETVRSWVLQQPEGPLRDHALIVLRNHRPQEWGGEWAYTSLCETCLSRDGDAADWPCEAFETLEEVMHDQ